VSTRQLAVFVGLTHWPCPSRRTHAVRQNHLGFPGRFVEGYFNIDGSSVPDAGLRVLDKTGVTVSDVRSDSKADFLFPPLAKGNYRLTTTLTGWHIALGDIEITSSKAASCTKPLSITLGLSGCQGGVSKRHR